MKPLGASQNRNHALPALAITVILFIIGIWGSQSASWIQECILQNVFTLVTVIVILIGCIVACIIPQSGLVGKCISGLFAGLFGSLFLAWIQKDQLVPAFLGASIVGVLLVVTYIYAPKMPRPAITLQGIPQIVLAGVLSNLLFVGLSSLTFFSLVDMTTNNSSQDARFWTLFVGFPLAGFVMGIVASLLAGCGNGGSISALISSIGWFIFSETTLMPYVHGSTSRDILLNHLFLFYVVIVMPFLGAFVMRARDRSPGQTAGCAITLFIAGLLFFLFVVIPFAPIVLLIWQYLPEMFSPSTPH